MRACLALISAGLAALAWGGALHAQQNAAQEGGCTLVMEPTGNTESVSLRVGEEDEAYVTHVWGGMRWTCGTAVMTADSAVRYDAERRVEMFGNVRYRDTIRTLESQRLDFFEDEDRMVARGNVLLTRILSGSTLSGPHVTFIRALSGIGERTRATGRPHVTLLPEPGQEGPPVDVDADRIDLIGERTGWASGEVVIQRPDLRAESDSAFFDMEEGSGLLYGTARTEREDVELRGDSIQMAFSEEELEQVRALGDGRAIGEQFEIRAEEIKAQLVTNEVDQVWAFGDGRSLAASSPWIMAADSMRFAVSAGQIDSIVTVGSSAAVEVAQVDLDAGEPTRDDESGNWVVGDTMFVAFRASDSGQGAGRAESPSQIEELEAVGDARSLYTLLRDTAQTVPSRNYLIGSRIRVMFDQGEAQRVQALRAIGIYLEPYGPDEAPPAAPVDADTTDAEGDGDPGP